MAKNRFKFLLFLSILTVSCNDNIPKYSKKRPSFKEVIGTHFIEVKRTFDSGLVFNKEGFQLYPERQFYILSEDSMKTWSPERKKYFKFKIFFDHDSVFNMHEEFVRFKRITKDSIVIQLLEVTLMKISNTRSNIYMTFYSGDYLKKRSLNVEKLRKPSRRDTMFILTKADKANRKPDSVESSFPATVPVVLMPKADWITVEKPIVKNENSGDEDYSDGFLYPTYNISIKKAYKDFNYSFSALIDFKGNLTFVEPESEILPEFKEAQIKIMKGIVDVYLRRLLTITPGKTLNIAHGSLIVLNVRGRGKSKK